MTTPRIYISGPISDPDPFVVAQRLAAFNARAAELRADGSFVVNPAENGLPLHASWEDHMRTDLRDMLDCDTILMLPGWSRSRGARLELHVAEQLGFAVIFEAVE